MEHRLYKRIIVEVDAIIHHHGQAAVRGKIRNLSQDGMFIEGAAMIFPIQSFVEVKLITHKNGCGGKQHLRAIVTHQSNKGIGLMFAMMSEDTFNSIDMLFHKRGKREFNMVSTSFP